jgi:hypothetical protein
VAKFQVRFRGYEENLVAELGIRCNNFIQKLFPDRMVDKAFIKKVSMDALKAHFIYHIARNKWKSPYVGDSLPKMEQDVAAEYGPAIDAFLEGEKVLIAELQFLLEGQELGPYGTRRSW